MKNYQTALVAILFITCLTGCDRKSRTDIFVVDLSKSITEKARKDTFEKIRDHAKRLERGDSIVVIPVTGDASSQTSGNVIRVKVSNRREAFDNDLNRFYSDLDHKLTAMFDEKNYSNTDLFGALDVANAEAKLTNGELQEIVIFLLSDMINSTSEIRFERSGFFEKVDSAKAYAKERIHKKGTNWNVDAVYVGLIESSEMQRMSEARQEAIRAFWEEFFATGGVRKLQFSIDGPGQISKFVHSNEED